MKTSPYLIQRLLMPFKHTAQDNPFTFGIGLKNGGLSEDAFKLLREIWRYDYMGSAEFEFGAIPKSFEEIVKKITEYIKGEIEVEAHVHDFQANQYRNKKGIVYFVCKKEDEQFVKEWIVRLADDKKKDYRTKERVCLASNICGMEYYKETTGWHDIDNHFLFFTDKEMFEKFCTLFSIK